MQNLDEKKLIAEFRLNNLEAFEQFFKINQPQMVSYAHKLIGDWESARDIVQEIFLNYWENKDHIEIKTSLRAYLFTAVKNQCANAIKHKIVHQKYNDSTLTEMKKIESEYYFNLEESHLQLYQEELNKRITESVNSLPEQCRRTFELSRYKGMKSQEIAEKMEVSVRTVETQIYRALKVLKDSLKDYLSLF